MKTIENVTIYKCDFCKKELKRKHAMVKHEVICSKNPLNIRPCMNCAHLITKGIKVNTGMSNDYTDDIYIDFNAPFCEKFAKFLILPKLEHKKGNWDIISVLHNGEDVEQEFMPKECDSFIGFGGFDNNLPF